MNRGQFLIDRRLSKGLSQSSLADKLGYSTQTISQWENDKGTPDLSVISKYASMLGIDLEGFIFCKNQKLNNTCDNQIFDISKFATNLKFVRKKNNLLQTDISKKLLVNNKTVGSWEKGLSTPNLASFIALCSYLRITCDELYFAFVTDSTIKQKPVHKKRIFIPVILPIVIVTSVGGTSTAIAVNQYRLNKIREQESHEVEPIIVTHHYEEKWSYDENHHWHNCIDEGYEYLYSDKAEHDLNVTTEGFKTTISCNTCDYQKIIEAELGIIEVYDEDKDNIIHINAFENIYVHFINTKNIDVDKISINVSDDKSLETREVTLFTSAGASAEVIDNNNLVIKKQFFSQDAYYTSEKMIYIEFTKINDTDLPANSFSFALVG